MKRPSRILLALFSAAIVALPVLAEPTTKSPVGTTVDEFALDNCYGKKVALSEFGERELVVLAFLGTECPLAKLYGPRLNQLQEEFGEDVQIIGINSNNQDSLTEIASFVHRHDIEFPMLKDVGNRVADELSAERTPEVFLLGKDRTVLYHGRIDDQYGVGYSREKTVKRELAQAIQEALAGKPISVPSTEPAGCHIGRVKKSEPTGEITFTKHIAPILNARCVSCHREGELAPFTLESFEDVQGWEDTILEVIEDNRMPPWSADPAHGEFANDARLSEREKDLIFTWVENGMPEGDASDLPSPPQFTKGWKIPEPDQIIEMRDTPFEVPAEGVVDYKRFVVDPGWDEDKFIYAAEARPQNSSVVHHIVVYVIAPGKRTGLEHMLAGYAPGAVPMHFGDGIAIHVPAKSRLLFEMHYTPNGSKQSDLSYLGVCFMDEKDVQHKLNGRIAIRHDFAIPPNDSDYKVTAKYRVRRDEMLLSMTPHMHLRGKSFSYKAFYPDGTDETLLSVPNYDFNWQLEYILDEPKRLPRGTEVRCVATYDNSEANLSNPNPGRTVYWGDQSFEEMMIGFMSTIDAE
ncbi:MAG: redoxin domain-containing protein [Planctomycetota bacterium]